MTIYGSRILHWRIQRLRIQRLQKKTSSQQEKPNTLNITIGRNQILYNWRKKHFWKLYHFKLQKKKLIQNQKQHNERFNIYNIAEKNL